jgi:hypothetical protein
LAQQTKKDTRMKRWTVVVAAVAAATVAGCSSLSLKNPFAGKKGPEPTTLPDRQWVELKRENATRLAGEGIPRGDEATTTPAAKPKGSELNQFFGFIEFVFYKAPNRPSTSTSATLPDATRA